MKINKDDGMRWGKCPYCHADAYSEDPEGNYFCYACGRGGNVNDTATCGFAGCADFTGTEDRKILAVYRDTADFYHRYLISGKDRKVTAFLNKRCMTDATVKAFEIGFAPDGYNTLFRHLLEKGYEEDTLMKTGLFKTGKNGNTNDFFWSRVMFPIKNGNGDVVAFGGRVLDDSKPKYLNSPESKYFAKGELLYGYPKPEEQKSRTIIICEGYMDCVTIKSAGFTDCAAVLGTALTQQHAQMLAQRYKYVYLALDSDGPGTNAIMRSIDILHEAGIKVAVPEFSPCKDPDEFIKKSGPEAFGARLKKSLPADTFTARHGDEDKIISILIKQASR